MAHKKHAEIFALISQFSDKPEAYKSYNVYIYLSSVLQANFKFLATRVHPTAAVQLRHLEIFHITHSLEGGSIQQTWKETTMKEIRESITEWKAILRAICNAKG